MSWTLSVTFWKRSWIRGSPIYSVASGFFFDDGSVDPAVCAFGCWTSRPSKMRESSRTCVGVKVFPARSATPSYISLLHAVNRLSFLKSRSWYMEKAALQPLQNLGRSGGSRPYCRKRSSIHSCAPSYVPFTVYGCTISHAPIFFPRRNRRATWTGSLVRVSASASSNRFAFRLLTSSLPYLRYAAWYAFLNSSWPLSAEQYVLW